MNTAPYLPSAEYLESIQPKLKIILRTWQEHVLFVDAETSCNLTLSIADPAVPLHDALTNLLREAQVLDFRIHKLDRDSGWQTCQTGKSFRSLERLCGFVDKPVGLETGPSLLRSAARRLRSFIKRASAEAFELEDRLMETMEQVLWSVHCVTRYESISPIAGLVDSIAATTERHEVLAREPEDAVYAVTARRVVEFEQQINECKAEELRRRESHWRLLLRRIADLGVHVRGRQTLITDFSEKEDEAGEQSEKGSEGESEEGIDDEIEYTLLDEDDADDEDGGGRPSGNLLMELDGETSEND